MLVLSRKIGQRIWIEPGIEIEILAVQGNRVKVGIAAPPQVAIRRTEVGTTNDSLEMAGSNGFRV